MDLKILMYYSKATKGLKRPRFDSKQSLYHSFPITSHFLWGPPSLLPNRHPRGWSGKTMGASHLYSRPRYCICRGLPPCLLYVLECMVYANCIPLGLFYSTDGIVYVSSYDETRKLVWRSGDDTINLVARATAHVSWRVTLSAPVLTCTPLSYLRT
jgi:hypothetical protein